MSPVNAATQVLFRPTPASATPFALTSSSASFLPARRGAAPGRVSVPAQPRLVPVSLYLESPPSAPRQRQCAVQTDASEWREEKAQAEWVPCALPAVASSEAGVQVDNAALFDFDASVEPALRTLLAKTLLQAGTEVAQEENRRHTEHTAADYNDRLAADEARVVQMERQEAERRQKQQMDVQAARQHRQKQHALLTIQLAAMSESRASTQQLQKAVARRVSSAQREQDTASVQRLVQDQLSTLVAPLHADQIKARAAIDQIVGSRRH